MKKILLILFLLVSSKLSAQQLNQNFAFTTAEAKGSINIIGRGLTYFQLVYTNTGPTAPSACTTVLQTSPDNVNWSTGITATCTSDGASTATAITTSYIRLNTTTLTRASNSTLTVNIFGWNSDPTVNSGVTGSGVNTRCAFWNGTTSLTSDADCTFATDTLTVTKLVGSTNIKSTSYCGSSACYALPASDGSANQVLRTDGSGNLSFASLTGSGTTTGTFTAGRIPFASSATNLVDSSQLTFDTTNGLTLNNGNNSGILLGPDYVNSPFSGGAIYYNKNGGGATLSSYTSTGGAVTGGGFEIDGHVMRGTFASPLKSENNDVLLNIHPKASNGTLPTFSDQSAIVFRVDGATTNGQNPGSTIDFYTNSNNASQTRNMRLRGDGTLEAIAGKIDVGTTGTYPLRTFMETVGGINYGYTSFNGHTTNATMAGILADSKVSSPDPNLFFQVPDITDSAFIFLVQGGSSLLSIDKTSIDASVPISVNSVPVITGTLSTGQVAVGSGTNAIEGSAALIFDATIQQIKLKTDGDSTDPAMHPFSVNRGIYFYDATGAEMLRIVATDPNTGPDYNSGNLYVGLEAGKDQPNDNSSSGYWNTGIGAYSLTHITTGNQNSAQGFNSLFTLTTGNGNVAFGNGAAGNLISGSQNTSIGYVSHDVLTTGSDNTGVGTLSGGNITTGSRNLTFGQTDVPNPAGNDQLVIGNGLDHPLDGGKTWLYGTSITLSTLMDFYAGATGDWKDVHAANFVMESSSLRTDTTNAHTGTIDIYDVDNTTYRSFITMTNGNTPTMAIATPSGGTLTIDAQSFKVGGDAGLTVCTPGVIKATSGILVAFGAGVTC